GIKPLYLTENNDLIAFASERKALWRLGIKDGIFPLNPGTFAIIGRKGIEFHKEFNFEEKSFSNIEFEETQKNLLSLLNSSVIKMIKYKKLGILFSGGLDSYLIAHIARNLGANVELFCSSFDKYLDKQNAFSGAKSIGLPLHFYRLTLHEIEESLTKILCAIEEPSPLNLSIAIPIYFATKLAKERSFKVVLSGQGSDEIFGGYAKYERILENEGYQKLRHRLCQDIFNIANKNLQRDDGASMANGVEIRLPFLDFKLINYAMRIPPEFKIKQINSNYVRKYILRSLAKSLNLPEEIVARKKTAVQYGSGSWKALKKLAEKNGYDSIQTYLQEEFARILKNYYD
ncbi:MAG: asparagine synthetase B, partial [Candidatus Bathyarchaeota archaeon]|nr:asparagine synthetase B [Candidatus Bathyarchaeota archaeon]